MSARLKDGTVVLPFSREFLAFWVAAGRRGNQQAAWIAWQSVRSETEKLGRAELAAAWYADPGSAVSQWLLDRRWLPAYRLSRPRSPGRPVDTASSRTRPIFVRPSAEERAQIEVDADDAGVTVAELARRRLFPEK